MDFADLSLSELVAVAAGRGRFEEGMGRRDTFAQRTLAPPRVVAWVSGGESGNQDADGRVLHNEA